MESVGDIKVYRGNIIFTSRLGQYDIYEKGYITVKGSRVEGVYQSLSLPAVYSMYPVVDYGDCIIIPGFVDLHCHASQYVNRGIGLDKELMDWLLSHAFNEEKRFENLSYAKRVYIQLVRDLIRNGTTRIALLGTIYTESTILLMDVMAQSGIGGFVGKVSMDRNAPNFYTETTVDAMREEERFLKDTINRHRHVLPIVTPRFVPATTPQLMRGLAALADRYDLPVQSHLSEDLKEIAMIRRLHPEFENYAEVYNYYGLFGQHPTIMAHTVYVNDEEIALMAKNGVYAAHCPIANFNLSGSIAPVRKLLQGGVPVGLGTDVGAGHLISIKDVMWQAIQASKVKSAEENRVIKPLSSAEVFYLGTKGGGSFFGKVGSFEPGYDFDALVIDDTNFFNDGRKTLTERLERFIYIGDDRNIIERFILGRRIGID